MPAVCNASGARYTSLPKVTLTSAEDRANVTHDRVRTDRVDTTGSVTLRVNGRLHHIGIGRTHVILLVADLDVRIVNATTGEPLRALTINHDRDCQPQKHPQKRQKPEPLRVRVSGMS